MIKIKIILFLLFAIHSYNCATFTTYPDGFQENLTLQEKVLSAKNLSLDFSQKTITGDESILLSDVDRFQVRDKIISNLNQSKVFKDVSSNQSYGDYNLSIIAVNKRHYSILLSLISGLSLYVIPANAIDDIEFSYVIKDKKNKVVGEYRRSASFSTWVTWFILPLTPFYFPKEEIETATFILLYSAIDEAIQAKIFK